jgi:sirohydrochlorin ferrochelatase
MTTKRSAAILVGHGSLREASGAAMMQVAEQLRAQRVTPIVEAGFLNFSQPTFAQAVAQAHAQGATSIIVQPYFLIQGHYVAKELPALVRTVAADYPGLRFVTGEVLGAHPALVRLAHKRLAAVNPAPDQATGVLFVAHGTPLPAANEPISRVLTQVQRQRGYGPAAIGYLECNKPSIPAAFAQLAAAGVRAIDVLPYFLHLGRHVRGDLPALFEEARVAHFDIRIAISRYLDFDPLLVDVTAERIMENLLC